MGSDSHACVCTCVHGRMYNYFTLTLEFFLSLVDISFAGEKARVLREAETCQGRRCITRTYKRDDGVRDIAYSEIN